MKLLVFRLLGVPLWVLLLCGCADSARQVEGTTSSSPPPDTATATDPPAAKTVSEELAPDATVASPTDAAAILASTLEAAKAGDKRVIVHLGAPW